MSPPLAHITRPFSRMWLIIERNVLQFLRLSKPLFIICPHKTHFTQHSSTNSMATLSAWNAKWASSSSSSQREAPRPSAYTAVITPSTDIRATTSRVWDIMRADILSGLFKNHRLNNNEEHEEQGVIPISSWGNGQGWGWHSIHNRKTGGWPTRQRGTRILLAAIPAIWKGYLGSVQCRWIRKGTATTPLFNSGIFRLFQWVSC